MRHLRKCAQEPRAVIILGLDGQKGSSQQEGMPGFPHECVNTCLHS